MQRWGLKKLPIENSKLQRTRNVTVNKVSQLLLFSRSLHMLCPWMLSISRVFLSSIHYRIENYILHRSSTFDIYLDLNSCLILWNIIFAIPMCLRNSVYIFVFVSCHNFLQLTDFDGLVIDVTKWICFMGGNSRKKEMRFLDITLYWKRFKD